MWCFIRTLIPILFCCWVTSGNAQALANAQVAAPAQMPPGFIPPPLNPTGIQLETRRLSDGVYALMSNTPFADNAGFVVGSDAVLVIDSHFNGAMGHQIINAVKEQTDLPIRYLLNTNAFGDHVFGNYVFPAETQIVAHRSTIEALKQSTVQGIAQTMRGTVGGDLSVFDGVVLRVPDRGFETQWSVDLGDTVVEMYWFGPSMSPHDSVVYLPKEKIAWTANMIFGAGTIPWARVGSLKAYSKTLQNFSDAIEPEIIVSGHGEIVGGEIVDRYQSYLTETLTMACEMVRSGESLEDALAAEMIDPKYEITPALETLMTGFHRWNIRAAYAESKQCAVNQG